MKALLNMTLGCFILLGSLSAQSDKTFLVAYDGEENYATHNIDPRFLGEYVMDKGKPEQQFIIVIDAENSTITLRTKDPLATQAHWDNQSKKEIEWAFLSDENGKPLVLKLQEFADGEMNAYPAMVFLYRQKGETVYHAKMLTQRSGNLFLDEAQKNNTVAEN